jgi:chorismate-pyruvate lyase
MPDQPSTPFAAVPFVYPLDDFYARAGLPLPPFEKLPGEEIPAPFHSLLVHDNDMTPTLEKFHGAGIHLRILNRSQREDFYFREVVLQLDQSERPVEFGANKVDLSLFPPKARQLILEERLPLGRILQECEVPHVTRAKAFFRVQADELISRALGMSQPSVLYGRRATIRDLKQRPLSEIVEILPP